MGSPHLFPPKLEAEPAPVFLTRDLILFSSFSEGFDFQNLLLRAKSAHSLLCLPPYYPFIVLLYQAMPRSYQLPQTWHLVLLTPSQEKQYL